MRRRPLLTFYALVIVISWGGGFIVLGADVFVGREPMPRTQMLLALACAWAGTTIAGLASVALVTGRSGLRELRDRWTTWRVHWGWYAFALLTAPVLATAILFLLAAAYGSSALLPVLLTAPDRAAVLLLAVPVALLNSFFEEMGWTGFAVPRFLRRSGIVRTGLIVGLLWGAWHYPMFAGEAFSTSPIAPAAYLALLLFGWLPPYRVLMVWAYDRTQSALIVWLMHVAIDVNALAILPTASREAAITYPLLFGAALWAIALLVVAADRVRSRRAVVAMA